jgi:hypothetical protein
MASNKTQRTFYLNGNLHYVVHINRSKDLATCFDYNDGKLKVYPWSEVRRKRGNAFTLTQAAKLINRHPDRIRRYMDAGEIERPQREYDLETGRPGRYFFSVEDMMAVHEFMSSVHRGRPRKDGKVTNNSTPDRETFRAMLDSNKLFYIKDEESGEFVPVWRANDF